MAFEIQRYFESYILAFIGTDRRTRGRRLCMAAPRLSFLARPEAATKYRTLAMAARFQPSAFSGQPLNKDSQHAFDFGYLLRQQFIIFRLDQF